MSDIKQWLQLLSEESAPPGYEQYKKEMEALQHWKHHHPDRQTQFGKVEAEYGKRLQALIDKYPGCWNYDARKMQNALAGSEPKGRYRYTNESDVILKSAPHTLEDYLKSAEERHHDSHLSTESTPRDITKPGEPRGLVTSLVKTIRNECGVWEVHGDLEEGFAVRHGNNQLPRRFRTLDEAEMALELFNHRRRRQQMSQDYINEKPDHAHTGPF